MVLTMKVQNLRQKNGMLWQGIKYPIKFSTSSLESSLCDYSDEYVLVTGSIAVIGANDITKLHLKIAHHSENAEHK